MSVQLFIQNAWQNNSKWLTALAPLSHLYGAVSAHQKRAYEMGKKYGYRAPVAVLVIGNITVGGAGKTPFIIALVRHWQTQGVRVGVISRGYGGDESKMPALVCADSLPCEVGDEPCLIVQKTGVKMAVCPNRALAIQTLLQDCHACNETLDVIVSDDGLQHYALARDDEWIIVDSERGFGNGKLLPQGFLREPITRLLGAKVIFHSQNTQLNLDKLSAHKEFVAVLPTLNYGHMYLKIDAPMSYQDYINTSDDFKQTAFSELPKQRVHAISGIGYPKRFFDSLRQLGFDVVEHAFADHHDFQSVDFEGFDDDLPMIVTEKDMIKIKHLDLPYVIINKLWVLPVNAVLSSAVIDMADQFVEQIIQKPLITEST